jgi:hypothetical protein
MDIFDCLTHLRHCILSSLYFILEEEKTERSRFGFAWRLLAGLALADFACMDWIPEENGNLFWAGRTVGWLWSACL